MKKFSVFALGFALLFCFAQAASAQAVVNNKTDRSDIMGQFFLNSCPGGDFVKVTDGWSESVFHLTVNNQIYNLVSIFKIKAVGVGITTQNLYRISDGWAAVTSGNVSDLAPSPDQKPAVGKLKMVNLSGGPDMYLLFDVRAVYYPSTGVFFTQTDNFRVNCS